MATLRADVNFGVTEYGIAQLQLRGKSIYQRVMELAQIAHPKFQESLVESAKSYHYIFADQIPPRSEDRCFWKNTKAGFPSPMAKAWRSAS
ncbi:MAG: acetyl-CoA hydrolase/transferase C-terminal domain-containing protein [Thermodesulfobacteriota bacterium]